MADADVVPDRGVPALLTPTPGTQPAPSGVGEMSLVDHLGGAAEPARPDDPRGGDRVERRVHPGRPDRAPSSRRRSRATTPLYFTGIGDAFVIKLKIAVVVGIILAMPVILWQVWGFIAPGPHGRRAAHRPALAPAGPRVLRHRRRDRLPDPAVRGRLPASASRRPTCKALITAGAVLRLRDHDVPCLRPDHGVPDPAVRPVAGRDRDLRAPASVRAGWRSSGSRSSPPRSRPAATSSARPRSACTMYLLFEGTIFFIRRSGK